MGEQTSQHFWEERYASESRVWSGRANAVLVDLCREVPPGRALDLGCGEGGDAIWLARHGWQVTAVDISTTAIGRGRDAARNAGVAADAITWVVQDLATWTAADAYDLVSAFFLQSPVTLPREEILRRAAAAVAPGGRLLIVSHAAPPPWATELHQHHHEFPTPSQDLAALALDETQWDAVVAGVRQRDATGPDGRSAVLDDAVVLVQRRPRRLDLTEGQA